MEAAARIRAAASIPFSALTRGQLQSRTLREQSRDLFVFHSVTFS